MLVQMNYKKTIKIFANLTLLICFILTYFLDLTGLELHQYLGIAAAGLLAVHIVTHWEWIMKVSVRIFNKVSGRVRVYYLLDGLLLIAFIVITITGVLISTWFERYISNYLLLRSIHIISSIGGLLLLIVKMGLHWKFFAKVLRPIRFPIRKIPLTTPASSAASRPSVYTRREAIKTIGVISAVGIFGVFKAVSAFTIPGAAPLPDPEVETIQTDPTSTPTVTDEPKPQVVQTEGGQKKSRRHGSSSQENLSESAPEQIPEQARPKPSPEILPDNPQEFNIPVENCIVRCDKGCAFPGLCRRYADQNQNQLCDLGECLPV